MRNFVQLFCVTRLISFFFSPQLSLELLDLKSRKAKLKRKNSRMEFYSFLDKFIIAKNHGDGYASSNTK